MSFLSTHSASDKNCRLCLALSDFWSLLRLQFQLFSHCDKIPDQELLKWGKVSFHLHIKTGCSPPWREGMQEKHVTRKQGMDSNGVRLNKTSRPSPTDSFPLMSIYFLKVSQSSQRVPLAGDKLFTDTGL